jgi:hypothetical protein
MKTIALVFALSLAALPALLPAMIGTQASAPSQALVAFDVDLDAGPGSVG